MTHIGGLHITQTGSVILTAKEVKEVEDHIDQLCAEAERYKAEYAMLCDGYGSMSREHSQTIIELSDAYEKIDQLEAENAKLRELASRMRDHIKSSCVECDELYCSSWDEDNGCCVYDTLAREAGIKVDE